MNTISAPRAGAWHLAALLAGNAALAFGPMLVRLADSGPVSAGFWRLLLPLPLFALLAWRTSGGLQPSRKTTLAVLGAGVFFALDLASWHLGIERTRLGNATLFGNLGSVILIVFGIVTAARWPHRLEALAVAAAFAGGGILLGRSLEISTATLVGDLFCMAAGLFYAFYLIPAQAARRELGQWSVLLLVCLAGAPVLLAIALVLGEPVVPTDWTPVIALAISSQIVGQGLLVFALKHFSPLVIGVALLTQPALAAAIGWWRFGEILTPPDMLGMALVASALVLARAAGAAPPAPVRP